MENRAAAVRGAAILKARCARSIGCVSIVQTAAMFAIGQVATPIVAYTNEVGWAAAGLGRPRAALIDVEFPELGNDRL